MPSLAEVAADAKDGLADLLGTTPGLRPADGIQVWSAPQGVPTGDVVLLGDVTITTDRPGYAGLAGAFTLSGGVMAAWGGNGEPVVRDARQRAAAYMGLIEQALTDQATSSFIPGPNNIRVATSGLREGMGDWQGQSIVNTQALFTITWVSHVT